ncbi:MAG: transcription elongation factor GreA [Chloroflexota bacterium]
MAEHNHFLTSEGALKLKAELDELRGPQRVLLAQRLRDAIQMGDLSENADYHKAKEDQGFLEGRIQELEYLLRNPTIIDELKTPKGIVAIGSHVTIQEDGLEPETYHLVGATEADPRSGKISHESPIGGALLNHKIGDIIDVNTPGGVTRLKIIKIE